MNPLLIAQSRKLCQAGSCTPFHCWASVLRRAVQMIGLDDATERKCRHKTFEMQLRERVECKGRQPTTNAYSASRRCSRLGLISVSAVRTFDPSRLRRQRLLTSRHAANAPRDEASVLARIFRLLDEAMSEFLLVHFLHNQRDQ